jgi:hypothetical protein
MRRWDGLVDKRTGIAAAHRRCGLVGCESSEAWRGSVVEKPGLIAGHGTSECANVRKHGRPEAGQPRGALRPRRRSNRAARCSVW